MGTTDPLPARVRQLAADNAVIEAENVRLKGEQDAALGLIAEQDGRIAALTQQVAELAEQVAASEPEPAPPAS